MHINRPRTAHADERGLITDILNNEQIEYVTVITSVKGAVRGHHFHKATTQWVYVLKGKLKVFAQMPGGPVETAVLSEGELVMNPPLERHGMTALEDTIFLVLTRGPRGGEDYEKDTYRLEQPLGV